MRYSNLGVMYLPPKADLLDYPKLTYSISSRNLNSARAFEPKVLTVFHGE